MLGFIAFTPTYAGWWPNSRPGVVGFMSVFPHSYRLPYATCKGAIPTATIDLSPYRCHGPLSEGLLDSGVIRFSALERAPA